MLNNTLSALKKKTLKTYKVTPRKYQASSGNTQMDSLRLMDFYNHSELYFLESRNVEMRRPPKIN